MKILRHLVLVIFFIGLAALEILHGLFRLDTIRQGHKHRALEDVERQFTELGRDLRTILNSGREHAAYLARTQGARAILAGDLPADASHRLLQAQLLPYLLSFHGIDRVRVFDREGRESFRCERIGGGVGSLPVGLLDPRPNQEISALARSLQDGEVMLAGLEVDPHRVEVPVSERQVINYVATIEHNGDRIGSLAMTVYAAPLLSAVRRFSPIPGIVPYLVDGSGDYLATSDRGRERGEASAGNLARDHPAAEAILLSDAASLESADAHYRAVPVSSNPPWKLVVAVPDRALEATTEHLRGEYIWVIGAMVASTVILAAAGAFFLRMSVREMRLRESERKKELEKQMAISERLGSLGLLTAGVAHEINNPLEGIGNYLALLERDTLPLEKRARYLELVRHGFNNIRDIVRDLSAFARPQVSSEAADISRVIEKALSMVSYAKELKEVTVERIGLDGQIPVRCDAGRLEQVFINLFINAGRAMSGRGRITVESRKSTVDGLPGAWVEVIVEDSGPGIPERLLSRIFDPFFTTSDGTGLGLSISFGIIHAHGGTISAGNRTGGGARFTVRLPAYQPAAAPERKRQERGSRT